MVMVSGGPAGPDAGNADGAWHQDVDADREALWDALGGAQGVLRGGTVTTVAGQLDVSVAAFSALLAERDGSGGTSWPRGYHVYADAATTVSFAAPSAAVRNDALVLAFADTEDGVLGSGVTQVGPQLIVVPGTSGTATPVPDATINTAVGRGGWVRLADVTINPGDTQIAAANLKANADASAHVAYCRLEKAADTNVADSTLSTITFNTVVKQNRSAFAPTGTTITVPADGYYVIDAQISWDSTANAGYRVIQLMVAGSPVGGGSIPAFTGSGVNDYASAHWAGYLTAGQAISVQGFQNNGSAVAAKAGSNTFLQVRAGRE